MADTITLQQLREQLDRYDISTITTIRDYLSAVINHHDANTAHTDAGVEMMRLIRAENSDMNSDRREEIAYTVCVGRVDRKKVCNLYKSTCKANEALDAWVARIVVANGVFSYSRMLEADVYIHLIRDYRNLTGDRLSDSKIACEAAIRKVMREAVMNGGAE